MSGIHHRWPLGLTIDPPCLNGPVWSPMSLIDRSHHSLTYGNNRFVIGDRVTATGNATASWSADGITWTAAASILSSSGFAMRIAHGNGIFYADINAILGATSTDGDTWTSRSHPSHLSTQMVPWFGNGVFIQTHGTNPTSLMTADGVTFLSGTTPGVNYSATGGCYGNGTHIAWGTVGACYSLDNGLTWTTATAAFGWQNLKQVAYGNGIFVGVGNLGSASTRYVYSLDGITWNLGTLPIARKWQAVTFANGAFLAASKDTSGATELITSADGLTWALSPNTFTAGTGYDFLTAGQNRTYVAVSTAVDATGEVGPC